MLALTDRLFIGNSYDEEHVDPANIAILNVALDMPRRQCSDDVEYMHVGLIDGPGNLLVTYCAAVLALASLLDRHKGVLICCHDGRSRSLTVATMYLILKEGKVSDHPTIFNHWRTWDQVLNELRYNTGMDLIEPHWSHKEAANKLPYSLLERLL